MFWGGYWLEYITIIWSVNINKRNMVTLIGRLRLENVGETKFNARK